MSFQNSNQSEEDCKQLSVLSLDFSQCDESHPQSHSNISLNSSLAIPRLRRTEIAPVPDRLAIAPSRYYISFSEDGDRWHIPLQLSLLEGWQLLDLLTWERDRATIFEIAKQFLGSAIQGDVA